MNNIIFDDTETDGLVRKRLEEEAKTLGGHALWERLREVDPETAEKVHENNLPRVIRGLEVFETTGIPLSQHKVNSRREKSPYNACIIGLTASDRQYLYDRINRRVDVMVENGLIEECRVFYDSFTPATAYQAIGYKELVPYFEGKAELCECLDKIKQETRQFDPLTGQTRVMRKKEFAHDYRYFPEPDLPPLVLTDEYIENIRKEMVELPDAKKVRFIKEMGLTPYDADVLCENKDCLLYTSPSPRDA